MATPPNTATIVSPAHPCAPCRTSLELASHRVQRAPRGKRLHAAPRGHNTYIRKRKLTYTPVYVMHCCAANDTRLPAGRRTEMYRSRLVHQEPEPPPCERGSCAAGPPGILDTRLVSPVARRGGARSAVCSTGAWSADQDWRLVRGRSLACAREVCVVSSSVLSPPPALRSPHTYACTLVLTYVHAYWHACVRGRRGRWRPEVQRGVARDPRGQHVCTPWTAPRA